VESITHTVGICVDTCYHIPMDMGFVRRAQVAATEAEHAAELGSWDAVHAWTSVVHACMAVAVVEPERADLPSDTDPTSVVLGEPEREWSAREVTDRLVPGGRPTDAAVERVRRKLQRAVDDGLIQVLQVPSARARRGFEHRYVAPRMES